MKRKHLFSTTSLNNQPFNRQVLDAVINGADDQEQAVLKVLQKNAVNDNAADLLAKIKAGQTPLSISDFQDILNAVAAIDGQIDLEKITAKDSLFTQQSFIDALRQGQEDAEKLKSELEALREQAKKEKGFLAKNFNIFTKENPLDEVMKDVASFEQYCRKNGIGFDEVNKQLVAGPRPKTVLDRLVDFRFLVAAAGGLALGVAGINPITALPALGMIPAAFFGGLPYIAVPFICLNIFKAFAEKSILKEAGTFAWFGGTMTAGFLISLGVTSLMSGFLTPIDMTGLTEAAEAADATGGVGDGERPFSPAQYILHGIVSSAVFASLYKGAKKQLNAEPVQKAKSRLQNVFNQASGIIYNKYTTSAIAKAGKVLEKLAAKGDDAFGAYMDYIGIPAILLTMAKTFSENGLAQLVGFGGYYATVFTGMATAAVALAAASYVFGARKEQFKSIFKTVTTAFSISSSVATMPVTKKSLEEMGVSEKTRNSVVPLGANFSMIGTALYLGTTAACATMMFGAPLGIVGTATILGIVLSTAFGTPGAPSSNIALLDPVLHKTGLGPEQIQKMYEIVIPADRLFDMTQTSLNVWGDMVVAMGKDKAEKKKAQKQDGPVFKAATPAPG